jgi:hypothetical protein
MTHNRAMLCRTRNRQIISLQALKRAFVNLRRMLATNADLARKLAELENKYDRQFAVVFDAIRQLMEPPPEPPKPRIGFNVKESAGKYKFSRKRR